MLPCAGEFHCSFDNVQEMFQKIIEYGLPSTRPVKVFQAETNDHFSVRNFHILQTYQVNTHDQLTAKYN